MSGRPNKSLVEEIAFRSRIAAVFVEKDWLVTQVIGIISSVKHEGIEVVFSGGTALSKAHRILNRFSEDIDFRVLTESSLDKPSTLRAALSKFKHAIIERLQEEGFPIEDRHVRARDNNRFFAIEIEYWSDFPGTDSLRPYIQLEMACRRTQLPYMKLPVGSLLNEVANQPAEVTGIPCIDPVESAADKISAVSWRIPNRVRGSKRDNPSIVRHIHDLALLKDRALASPDFLRLVEKSLRDDADRGRNDPSLQGIPMVEKLKHAMSILTTDPLYEQEYNQFVVEMSYAKKGQIPDYKGALSALQQLVDTVSALPVIQPPKKSLAISLPPQLQMGPGPKPFSPIQSPGKRF